MRSTLFWDITQHMMVIPCQPLGTSIDPPIRCPDRSARNYHYALRNIPKEHRSKERLLLSIKVPGSSAKLLNFTIHTARRGRSFFMICRKVNLASLLVDIRRGLITAELQLRHATYFRLPTWISIYRRSSSVYVTTCILVYFF
jgi:hypothetical protein